MTRHQVATELSDIRREITRLQRREALLLNQSLDQTEGVPRPGWPMRRDATGFLAHAHASAAMSSTSAPSRTAV